MIHALYSNRSSSTVSEKKLVKLLFLKFEKKHADARPSAE